MSGFALISGYMKVECFREDFGKMAAYYYTWAYVGGVLGFFVVFYLTSYCSNGGKGGRRRGGKGGRSRGEQDGGRAKGGNIKTA